MSHIESELLKLLEAKTGVQPGLNDTMDVLKIDSLAMAELTVEIEKTFGIRIDDDVLDVNDVCGFIEYIQRKTTERGTG